VPRQAHPATPTSRCFIAPLSEDEAPPPSPAPAGAASVAADAATPQFAATLAGSASRVQSAWPRQLAAAYGQLPRESMRQRFDNAKWRTERLQVPWLRASEGSRRPACARVQLASRERLARVAQRKFAVERTLKARIAESGAAGAFDISSLPRARCAAACSLRRAAAAHTCCSCAVSPPAKRAQIVTSALQHASEELFSVVHQNARSVTVL